MCKNDVKTLNTLRIASRVRAEIYMHLFYSSKVDPTIALAPTSLREREN